MTPIRKKNSDSNSSGVQGEDEQQTEEYTTGTSKEQSQSSTQQSAESTDGVSGSARKQDSAVQGTTNESLEEAILYAKKYIEDLLAFFGLNSDVYATSEDDEVIELDIPSTHLNGFLIGQGGETMRALQYTISNALKAQNFSHTRVNVDIAGYKKQRAERVVKNAEQWFTQVRDSGEAKELPPMNPADRRAVHQAATDYGLQTESVGFGRERHIVLKPAKEGAAKEK